MLPLNLFIISFAILSNAKAQASLIATTKGCYMDNSGEGGPLEPPGIKFAAGSAQDCPTFCASYAYAGWDGSSCFCGNLLNTTVLSEESTDTCAGIDKFRLRKRGSGSNIVIYSVSSLPLFYNLRLPSDRLCISHQHGQTLRVDQGTHIPAAKALLSVLILKVPPWWMPQLLQNQQLLPALKKL